MIMILIQISLPIIFLGFLVASADAHGYLKSPRSRNYYAHVEGSNSMNGPAGKPPAEYCPHCLNFKTDSEICGTGQTQNYDVWNDVNGNPMPWISQGTFTEGGEIVIEVDLTTNHAGHIEVYACPDGSESTQACFLDHPLTFMEDLLYGGPVDDHYPVRAYVSPAAEFKFKYRLPVGVKGDRVMLQWRYITANSCFPPGYFREELGLDDLGWLRSTGMSDCSWPLNWTGERDATSPEQFFNCAEITISPGNPTLSPSPTEIPVPIPSPVAAPVPAPISAPIVAPSPNSNEGCCTWNGGESCGPTWCNESKSNCEGNCNGTFLGEQPSTPTAPTPTAPTPTAPTPTAPTPTSTLTASTTRYWDCSGGACGCAYLTDASEPAHCYSNAMFTAPTGNKFGAKFYGTAAISEALGGGNWLAEGCGKCWKVRGWSNVPNKDSYQTTIVLKGTNFCPPSNPACSGGNAHFDISAPGFDVTQFSLSNTCATREPDEFEGFASCGRWMIDDQDPDVGCDCSEFQNPILRAGCENFYSLMWNNVEVDYEEVDCPDELNRLNCWEENGYTYPFGIPEFCASNVENEVTSAPTSSIPSPTTPSPTAQTSSPVVSPTISTSSPTVTTSSPTLSRTSSPTEEVTTSHDEYCCSNDLKNCSTSGWCNENENNCRGCDGHWIAKNPNCELKRWDNCKGNPNGCCPPATCVDFGYWAQCLV